MTERSQTLLNSEALSQEFAFCQRRTPEYAAATALIVAFCWRETHKKEKQLKEV